MRTIEIEGGLAHAPQLQQAGVRLLKVVPDDLATPEQIAHGRARLDALAERLARVRPTGQRVHDSGTRRRTQAEELILIATGEGVTLYRSPDGTSYADIMVAGHRETWRTRSREFRQWLQRAYYMRTGGAARPEALSTAMGIIEAHCQFDGVVHPVYLRVAAEDERIYIDLGDTSWRAIEVDREGWRLVGTPPVRFRRAAHMCPLPVPIMGGTIDELRRHLNLSDQTFVLVVGWLLSALRGRGPYPILALNGEQGAGKSTTAVMLRQLVDPSTAPLRSAPRDLRDLAVTAFSSFVLAFDNLSGLSADLADAICRLSTGGGFSTRALYTDDEERVFEGRRPVMTTSITDVATRSDLADRSIAVTLEAIDDVRRRTDKDVHGAFERAAPAILGALLDAVSEGLRGEGAVQLSRLPRMADHAVWVQACEPRLWEVGRHLSLYERNRGEAAEIVLEADPVAMALRSHMETRGEIATTSTELLAQLAAATAEHVRRGRDWPPNARALAGRLRRLAPALRRIGLGITFEREAMTGRRIIRVAPLP